MFVHNTGATSQIHQQSLQISHDFQHVSIVGRNNIADMIIIVIVKIIIFLFFILIGFWWIN
jgi:hypothetical protein